VSIDFAAKTDRAAASELLRLIAPKARRYQRPGDLARIIHAQDTSPALKAIDDALIELTDPASDFNALEVTMPPQEGKSQRVSRTYAEWLLDYNPRLRIAIVSYAEEISTRWGRDIKLDVAQHPCASGDDDCREPDGLHILIREDSRAAGRWAIAAGAWRAPPVAAGFRPAPGAARLRDSPF